MLFHPFVSACNSIGSNCHCDVQDSSACSALDHTVCDTVSGACICDPATHTLSGGSCVFAFQYFVDGSSWAPLIQSTDDTLNFEVKSGPDAVDGDIPSNTKYLYVEGSVRSYLKGFGPRGVFIP